MADFKNLQNISHAMLLSARANSQSPEVQAQLAPAEHRAFAREWTQENPVLAVPSLAAAIPLYTLAKALRLQTGRSPPSWNEIGQGYAGIGDGLQALANR